MQVDIVAGPSEAEGEQQLLQQPVDRAAAGKSGKVCDSEACKEAAEKILETMDPSVDPCQDFYRFACGKFLREGKIPKGSSKLEMLTPMNKELMAKGRQLLDEEYKVWY